MIRHIGNFIYDKYSYMKTHVTQWYNHWSSDRINVIRIPVTTDTIILHLSPNYELRVSRHFIIYHLLPTNQPNKIQPFKYHWYRLSSMTIMIFRSHVTLKRFNENITHHIIIFHKININFAHCTFIIFRRCRQ